MYLRYLQLMSSDFRCSEWFEFVSNSNSNGRGLEKKTGGIFTLISKEHCGNWNSVSEAYLVFIFFTKRETNAKKQCCSIVKEEQRIIGWSRTRLLIFRFRLSLGDLESYDLFVLNTNSQIPVSRFYIFVSKKGRIRRWIVNDNLNKPKTIKTFPFPHHFKLTYEIKKKTAFSTPTIIY